MSLSASMWTSVSGLMTHGEKMNVIGNNLANVSTIGFKAQRCDFSDFIYTDYGTTSGADQVGKGTGICALIGDFSQGGFENTNSATDLAINGNGFFKVRNDKNDTEFYTRAGDFYFDEDRQLVNPNGMIVQGWKTTNSKTVSFGVGTVTLDEPNENYRRSGNVTDIILDKWNIPPQRTTNVTIANSLVNEDRYDVQTSNDSPLTALFDTWDGRKNPPIADDAYATQSTIAAYDEGGKEHKLTVYMDKVNDHAVDSTGKLIYEIESLPPGYNMYEYLVTIDPSEDKRTYGGEGFDPETGKWKTEPKSFYDDTINEDGTYDTLKCAGVLMSGVMIFDAAGQLVTQTAYTYGGQADTNGVATTIASNSNRPSDENSLDLSLDIGDITYEDKKGTNGTFKALLVPGVGDTDSTELEIKYQTDDTEGKVSLVQTEITEYDGYTITIGDTGDINVTRTPSADPTIPPVLKTDTQYTLYVSIPDADTSTSTGVPQINENNQFQPDIVSGFERENGKVINLSKDMWQPTRFSSSGLPVFIANFTGDPLANCVWEKNAENAIIELDLGLASSTTSWSTTKETTDHKFYTTGSLADLVKDENNKIDYIEKITKMESAHRDDNATANNGTTFMTDIQDDGYKSGILSNYTVDTDGVLYGYYNNGESLPLYQIAMYDFHNHQGLYREGGNLYSPTHESGSPVEGVAGTGTFGSIQSFYIENSNVDMSREFVHMISTQRGFQANSKSITTTDTMLETVIGMKR